MSLWQSLGEFYPPKPKFTEENVSDLSGKVYLITGGTSGIGLSLAKILYSKNARVYITSRSAESAMKAIQEIKNFSPGVSSDVEFLAMDLTDLTQIAPAVKHFLRKEPLLHSAWYNAGVMNVPRGSKTKQGYELQWGTNVVAHFIISQLLLPTLIATAKVSIPGSVRAVWVSSDGHINYSPTPDGINWEDVMKQPVEWKEDMAVMKCYGQSKVGNLLLAKETAARYGRQGIVGVALNPGHLRSNLQRDTPAIQAKIVDILFLHDSHLGALTEAYAGLSNDVGLENNGAYVIPWGRIGATRADIDEGFHKRGTGQRLWDMLEEQTKSYL